jgi:hypothetical protein
VEAEKLGALKQRAQEADIQPGSTVGPQQGSWALWRF